MTTADKLVVLAAAALLPLLYGAFWGGGPASEAVLFVAGSGEQRISLAEDQELNVHGPLGDSTIKVENGRIRFTQAPCNGQQCVHAGWLERAGDIAACLPNGISLALAGTDQPFDSINF